jgi:hypothetical protein
MDLKVIEFELDSTASGYGSMVGSCYTVMNLLVP